MFVRIVGSSRENLRGLAVCGDLASVLDVKTSSVRTYRINTGECALFGERGVEDGKFQRPSSRAFAGPHLYILDQELPRVQVFL